MPAGSNNTLDKPQYLLDPAGFQLCPDATMFTAVAIDEGSHDVRYFGTGFDGEVGNWVASLPAGQVQALVTGSSDAALANQALSCQVTSAPSTYGEQSIALSATIFGETFDYLIFQCGTVADEVLVETNAGETTHGKMLRILEQEASTLVKSKVQC